MSYELSLMDVTVRLGVAFFCGLVLGLDREMKHKNVGVRPFLLVALGSAAFSILIIEVVHYYAQTYPDINPDPSRIIQGIITGIGFLGGGAIMQSKGQVTGAATGAGIWLCGAIGVACGYGFHWHALIITGYAFAILCIIGVLRARCRDDLEEDDGDIANKNNNETSSDG